MLQKQNNLSLSDTFLHDNCKITSAPLYSTEVYHWLCLMYQDVAYKDINGMNKPAELIKACIFVVSGSY